MGSHELVVVTPTYAPDLDLFTDLHESVLRRFPAEVRHMAVVDEPDLALFRRFEGDRCLVLGVRDVLPGPVRALPGTKLRVNLRRPLPPLRGWVVQQLVKLAVAEQLSERVVVLADSDLVFIRPVTEATFTTGGRVRLYRREGGVDESLPRHLRWHALAHRLLGMGPPSPPPLPDYVSSLMSWDSEVVRRMLRQVVDASGRPWLDAVGGALHVSEWTLYGVFADQLEQARDVSPSDESLCHPYWDTVPLTTEAATALLASVDDRDVAYMIGAKSHTPLRVRRAAHAAVFGR